MRALHVRPEAELDMFEAALWYDREQSGLGGEFLKAVRYVFGRIEEGALQSSRFVAGAAVKPLV